MVVSERCEFPPMVKFSFRSYTTMVVSKRCELPPIARFLFHHYNKMVVRLPIKWIAVGATQMLAYKGHNITIRIDHNFTNLKVIMFTTYNQNQYFEV